jgi:hypothetical protein
VQDTLISVRINWGVSTIRDLQLAVVVGLELLALPGSPDGREGGAAVDEREGVGDGLWGPGGGAEDSRVGGVEVALGERGFGGPLAQAAAGVGGDVGEDVGADVPSSEGEEVHGLG